MRRQRPLREPSHAMLRRAGEGAAPHDVRSLDLSKKSSEDEVIEVRTSY